MKPAPAYPPRGLRRLDAARYLSISPTTFDAWVATGRMPQPKRIGGVVLFDREAIDLAFDALGESVGQPADAGDDWEAAFGDPETGLR